MTEKMLEELGFYKNGTHILQLHSSECNMDLGWFGLRVDDFKKLTPVEFVKMIYKAGRNEGYKEGQNTIKQAIHDILKIEE